MKFTTRLVSMLMCMLFFVTAVVSPASAATKAIYEYPKVRVVLNMKEGIDGYILNSGNWEELDGCMINEPGAIIHVIFSGVSNHENVMIRILKDGREIGRISESVSALKTNFDGNRVCVIQLKDYLDERIRYACEMSIEARVLRDTSVRNPLNRTFMFDYDTYTPQMRYVNMVSGWDDYRGPHAGYYDGALEERYAKWQDTTPRSVDDRKNSGYLMLQEERHYWQDDWWNRVKVGYVQGANIALDVTGATLSLGLSALPALSNEEAMKDKFGSAGSKAVPYYAYLQALCSQYSNDLLREAAELDFAVDKVVEITGDIVEYVGKEHTLAYYEKHDTMVFRPNQSVTTDLKKYHEVHITKAEMKSQNVCLFSGNIDGQPFANRELYEIMWLTDEQKPLMVSAKNATVSGVTGKNGAELMIDQAQKTMVGTGKNKISLADQCTVMHMDEGMKVINAAGGDSKMSAADKEAIKKLNGYVQKQSDLIEKVENGFSAVGIAVEVVQLGASIKDRYITQHAYYSALCSVTKEYIDAIEAWKNGLILPNDGKGDDENLALQAAIDVVYEDLQSAFKAQSNKIVQAIGISWKAFDDTKLYNEGSFMSLCLNALDLVTTLYKPTDELKKKVTETLGKYIAGKLPISDIGKANYMSMIVSAGNFVLKLISSDYLNYQESIKAAYAMVDSLCISINGAISDYMRERTHEDACKIIEMLHMLKNMKYFGEQLVEYYYLSDYYEQFSEGYRNELQTILWNEMELRGLGEDVEITEYLTWIGNKTLTQKEFDEYIDIMKTYYDRNGLGGDIEGAPVGDRLEIVSDTPIEEIMNEEVFCYSNEGVTVKLTPKACIEWFEMQDQLNTLLDLEVKNDSLRRDRDRFIMVEVTKGYIESFPMFDPSEDYL